MDDIERAGVDELRTLFLFESLADDQLEWLADHGWVEHRAAGEPIYSRG